MSNTPRENIAVAAIVLGVFVAWIGFGATGIILLAAGGVAAAAYCLKDSDW